MADLDPIKQVIQIDVKEKGVTEATKDFDNLQTSITETTTATAKGNAENKKTEEGFKTLKIQLREAIALQQKMSAQYGATSEQAIKATKAVAGIKDEIGFQKQLVESYNPDDKFRKLTQTAGVAALALGGVKDGFTALGIESKTLDKIIGSAQAILGVTSAVAGMSDAYAVLTASKRAKSAADVVEAGTTEALVVVEGQATAATWSWNAALLANPIVLIAAGIVAASAAIYAFVKITGDAVKEEEKAKVASMQLTFAIDQQAKAFDNNNNFAKASNSHKIDLLRASGASEAQIYKETKALAEQELQLAKNYRAQSIVAEQKAYEANRDNPTEFNAETLKKAQENIEKARTAVSVGYDGLIALQNSHEVAVVQAQTDARKKAEEAAEKARQKAIDDEKKANDDEKKRLADIAKAKLDAEMQSAKDAMAIVDELNKNVETPAQKEQREYEEKKVVLEANNLSTEELTTQHLIKIADIEQEARDKKAIDDKAASEKEIEEKKKTDDAILSQKKAVQEGQLNLADSAVGFLSEIAGKNKKLQKAAIIAESALGIGRSVISTNAANVAATAEGAALAIPTAGASVAAAAGLVTSNYIALGLGTAANIAATAKALQALGGGSAPSGGSTGGAVPTRNVAQVGFQGSSENQISTAIAQQQKEQPPIQAFVVSQALTDQQELDRKKQLQNSF